jgi:hypothetical protein
MLTFFDGDQELEPPAWAADPLSTGAGARHPSWQTKQFAASFIRYRPKGRPKRRKRPNVTTAQAAGGDRCSAPPEAAFLVEPLAPKPGQAVTLNAAPAHDANGPIQWFEWDFNGDGGFDERTRDARTRHTFARKGRYDVTLRVVDRDGDSQRVTRSVNVGVPPGRCALLARKWGPRATVIEARKRGDVLRGTRRRDVICGSRGNDVINAQGGRDVVYGRAGRDRLLGGTGGDRLVGETGDDRAWGGPGTDRVYGGAGADRLFGGPGRDRLYGEAGKDRLYAKDQRRDFVFGGGQDDRAYVDRRDRRSSVRAP